MKITQESKNNIPMATVHDWSNLFGELNKMGELINKLRRFRPVISGYSALLGIPWLHILLNVYPVLPAKTAITSDIE